MIDYILIILIITAIITMLVALLRGNQDPSSITFAIVSSVLWFIVALGILEVEIPYQIFNVTSGNIETGVQVIETMYPLALLFMMLGLIMFISFVVLVGESFNMIRRR